MSLQTTAASAVKRFGASCRVTHHVPGTVDVGTGVETGGTNTTVDTSAILDAASVTSLGFKFGKDLVQTGDMKAIVPASDFTTKPALGDTLAVLNGAYAGTYSIQGNQPVISGSDPVIYELLVRVL